MLRVKFSWRVFSPGISSDVLPTFSKGFLRSLSSLAGGKNLLQMSPFSVRIYICKGRTVCCPSTPLPLRSQTCSLSPATSSFSQLHLLTCRGLSPCRQPWPCGLCLTFWRLLRCRRPLSLHCLVSKPTGVCWVSERHSGRGRCPTRSLWTPGGGGGNVGIQVSLWESSPSVLQHLIPSPGCKRGSGAGPQARTALVASGRAAGEGAKGQHHALSFLCCGSTRGLGSGVISLRFMLMSQRCWCHRKFRVLPSAAW